MEKVITHIRDDNHVTIVCPKCKRPESILVEYFKNKTKQVKVRCPCSEIFEVEIDYRRFYRKPTKIPGMFKPIKPPGRGGGEALIINLSKGGLGFRAFTDHNLQVGQVLQVSFELNDKKNTYLQKEVTVQSIEGDYIGCRFSDPDLFEKALGFYLQS